MNVRRVRVVAVRHVRVVRVVRMVRVVAVRRVRVVWMVAVQDVLPRGRRLLALRHLPWLRAIGRHKEMPDKDQEEGQVHQHAASRGARAARHRRDRAVTKS